MFGYDKYSAKLNNFDIMFAGAASGFITRATCQPLDVLKIRFQLQVEPIVRCTTSKYHSVPQAAILILREEGLRALWKGHVPAQLLSIVYGLSQFWAYEFLHKELEQIIGKRYQFALNFASGATAGSVATVASFPFDVIRTRLVAQSDHHRVYTGVVAAFQQIIRNEGALVLFRGLFPTFIQVAPHAGVQFMCYHLFDEIYRKLVAIDSKTFTLPGSVVCGSLAGLCAKLAIYPLDLTKKRMQIQGIHHHRKAFGEVFACNGMIDCLQKIYKNEGRLGLFKGLTPSLLKAVVTTAIHFSAYEFACKVIADLKS